jgi:hypothetical protein
MEVGLDDLDVRLRHRSAERIVKDGNLRTRQLHPATDQQQHHEKQDESLHRSRVAAMRKDYSRQFVPTALTSRVPTPSIAG